MELKKVWNHPYYACLFGIYHLQWYRMLYFSDISLNIQYLWNVKYVHMFTSIR